MRTIILVIFAVCMAGTMTSCGSIKFETTGDGWIEKDGITNSLSKKDNYILSNEWMVEAFNNAESVIQFSDKEAGIVKGKYHLYSGEGSTGYYRSESVSAIITLRVKDDGVRIEIDTRGTTFGYWQATGIYNNGPIDGMGYNKGQAEASKRRLIESFKNRLSDED